MARRGTVKEVEGYCTRCKAPRKMVEVKYIRTSGGRPAAQGRCPICKSKMFKYVREKDVPPGAFERTSGGGRETLT